ncbi:MAG: hypothetical protein ACLUIS_11755 [Longibaculum sp.]
MYINQCVLGAGDPRKSLDETMKGNFLKEKSVRKLLMVSSYGNQIGLTTGYVHEVYDDGFVAKRMELGQL